VPVGAKMGEGQISRRKIGRGKYLAGSKKVPGGAAAHLPRNFPRLCGDAEDAVTSRVGEIQKKFEF